MLNSKNEREGYGITAFGQVAMEEGEYKNDNLNGYGRIIYCDGCYMQGMFEDGEIKGNAEFFCQIASDDE